MPKAQILISAAVCVIAAVTSAGCGGNGASGEKSNQDATLRRATIASERAERAADRAAARRRALQAEVDRLRPASETEAPAASDPGSGSTSGDGDYLKPNAAASFATLASKLSGEEGIAISTPGLAQPVQQVGALMSGVAWSTSKVPVAMAAISAGVADPSALSEAITASDNAAAERLWVALGGGSRAAAAATAQLRAAGDKATQIQAQRLRPGYTAFGQTAWTIADQAAFTAGMTCTPAGQKVLSLMGQTIGAQRWGLGAGGGAAQIKGGWGPGRSAGAADGWLDRQMGLTQVDGHYFAAALITAAPSHAEGTANLTQMATWLVENLNADALPTDPAC